MGRSKAFEEGQRPLKWGDLTPTERRVTESALSAKSENIGSAMLKEASAKKGSEKVKFEKAAADPELVEAPNSIAKMKNRLVSAMTEASAPENRAPGEDLAGQEFYFDHREPIADASEASGQDVGTAITASSRMSPRTPPTAERRTIRALGSAHAQGSVTFSPDLTKNLKKGYVKHGETDPTPVDVPPALQNQKVPFKDLPKELVPKLRKRDFDTAVTANSSGVDWENMRAVSLDRNVASAHAVLQGDTSHHPDPNRNPKQYGYEESIASATPDTRDEYRLRAKHISDVLQGHQLRGQTTLDVTGLQDSNEGILGNESPIAADMWTRAEASGQPAHLGSVVANTYFEGKTHPDPKTGEDVVVGKGDPRIDAIALEHAAHQHAVELAAKQVQKNIDSDFTVPSRMVQETGGWAVPRRRAGKDPGYNAIQRAAAKKPPKPAAPDHVQGSLF